MPKTKDIKPPFITRFFLERMLSPYNYSVLGDMEERFYIICEDEGVKKAKWWYRKFFLKSIFPFFKNLISWSATMFKNYFKIALRNLTKHKTYSAINISGLAVGFTCCLVIFLFVKDELSYDTFHEKGDRIYRLTAAYLRQGVWEPYSTNSWRTGEMFEDYFEAVEEIVRIRTRSFIIKHDGKRITERRFAEVDNNFFDVFTFDIVSGDKATALEGSFKVIISQSTAERYFGAEDPLGKVFTIDNGGTEFQLTVAAVMKDMPNNSHFHFDFLVSGDTSRQINSPGMFTNTGWDSQFIYFTVPQGYDTEIIESQFIEFLDANINSTFMNSGNFKLDIQRLKDIHLYSNNGTEIETNSNIAYIYIFSTIAFITLLIACINYMNLATARSTGRAREVGMRKVLGAYKGQLIKQFLGESVLLTFVAFVVALSLTYLILPSFNTFAGKSLSVDFFGNAGFFALLIIATMTVGIAAGSYPAFFLSTFQPLMVLKGILTHGTSGAKMRKGLVIMQFSLSVILIISTGVVFDQLQFLRNKELGINKDRLIAVPLQTMQRNSFASFKNELLSSSQISSVGTAHLKLPGWLGNSTTYNAEDFDLDMTPNKQMKIVWIDRDFLDTIEAEFVYGRNYSREFPADSIGSIILNEAAVAQLGWEGDPTGKWFQHGSTQSPQKNVIGVVKNFHYESLHRKIAPTVFALSPAWSWAYIKMSGNDVQGSIAFIEDVYGRFVTDRDFRYSFIDDDMDVQYNGEEKFLQIFGLFTSLAIAIACLGIFGLASFTAEKRTKEIGVRKVLGATVGKVVRLLIKEFTNLVLIANMIAWPLAYYFMNKWLDGFVYRTSIDITIFIASTAVALVIAVATVTYQATKAANANPVNVLRSE